MWSLPAAFAFHYVGDSSLGKGDFSCCSRGLPTASRVDPGAAVSGSSRGRGELQSVIPTQNCPGRVLL